MSRLYWAAVRVAHLRKMLMAGCPTSEIEAHFGKTKFAIQTQAQELGLKTVRKNIGVWTPEVVDRFVKLCRAGNTTGELARIFGVSRDVIAARRSYYDVTYKAMKMKPPRRRGGISMYPKIEREWTQEEDEVVIRGHGRRYLALSVGNQIHRFGHEVMARAVVLGLGPWPDYQPNQKGSIYVT